MLRIPAAEYAREGRRLILTLPSVFLYSVDRLTATLQGWMGAELFKPGRPRTTGWKSQNHHVNGHCEFISGWTGCAFESVKRRMKELTPGWHMDTLPDGSTHPGSEKDADTILCASLIETIHVFAAEYMIPLIEE